MAAGRIKKRLNELGTLLRSDRGDADPILTIGSALLSAIVSASILGAMILTITWGTNYVLEQTRATGITNATKLWSLDANDASIVTTNTNDVIFYDMPGKHPGVYVSRADGRSQDDLTCRKSEWTLVNGVLSNKVSTFAASNPTCDYGNPAIQPTATLPVISVDGFNSAASFTATNSAGRDLHFVNGTEVGLAASSVGTPNQSTATRASWWRDYEWAYTQPRTLNIVGNVSFPLSGVKPTSILGTTWLEPTPQGATSSTAEPTPVTVTYTPGPITATVTRSSTLGALYGGYHEGVTVNITQPATCGPYSVQYDVVWTPTTAGAPSRSTTLTTFTSPAPIDIDQVPNGSSGTMKVTASCPSAVQSGANSVASVAYSQPLPAPVLTVAALDATRPNVHTLAWAPVSSLASVVYRTQVQTGGAAWVDQQQATPNPDPTPGKTIAWQLGSTFGVQFNYHVTPSLGSTIGTVSSDAGILTPWPPVTNITWDPYVSSGLNLTTTLSTYDSCPAGTTAQYQQRLNDNEAGWFGWTAWSSTRDVTNPIQQGHLAQILGEVRCAYNAAQYTPAADWGHAPQFNWVQPITTIPMPPTITASNPNWGPTATVTLSSSGCPADTTYEFKWQYAVDNNGVNGAWTGFTDWSAAATTSVNMNQGSQLEFQAVARCVSPYTWDAPTPAGYEPQVATNGSPSGVASLAPLWVRPIATPAPTTNIWNDAGGTSAPINNRFLWNPVACPAGTWAQYRSGVNGGWYADITAGTTRNVPTSYGTKYTPSVGAQCSSTYANSTFADVTGAYWITNVPQATGVSNSVSPNTIYMGSSAAVNVWGAVCPPGTFPVYSTVDSRGNPHSGSFTDSPPSTGTWTYATTASCKGPDAAGAASVPARAYLTVINPPPPNWAGSNPSGMFSSCYANSVQVTGFWTNVTNATSFSGTSYVTVLGVTYSAPASVSYSGGQWISSSAFNGFSAFQVTASHIDVTASGAGGSTFQQITASYSTC